MSEGELVDVLAPPHFEPTGTVKPVMEAVDAGDWLGAINLWIVRPGPALIYQERPPGGWAPGKLDGSVAGYYRAGETGTDGLREAEEELGRRYRSADVTPIRRRLNVGVDSLGRERRAVITIFMTYDDAPLSEFVLDPEEVPAMYEITLADIARVFAEPGASLRAEGLDCHGQSRVRTATADDFSYMWDGYHHKVALLAQRYFEGERTLLY